ncbi:MAG: TonB-dependent receptor [Alphaproteobacteria bacterium]|nr:TonB-dependent receptor [Alphaproteobacteria bacterium]
MAGILPLILSLAGPSSAAPGADAPGDDAPPTTLPEPVGEATLPVLVRDAAAPYPPDALALGLGADVLLVLDVDADGTVLAAAVASSAVASSSASSSDPEQTLSPELVAAFDAAALQAARSFQFEPARTASGEAVPARIQYRYRFVADRAPPLRIVAVVTAGADGPPLSDVDVVAAGPDGVRQLATTDADGVARFAGLADGDWDIAVQALGLQTATRSISLSPDGVVELTFPMVADAPPPTDDVPGEVITITAEALPPQVTERVLTMDQVRYLPGTGGDVVKAVQNLPGVNRAPLGVAQILIRGTAPEDSKTYIDGMALPIVFHFAGLNTVVNSDSLEEVAFLPGSYGVRYGRTLAGLVDLRTTPSLPQESGGYVSVDLFQATAFHEQRIGDRTAVSMSARRSYVDTILTPVLTELTGSTFQAPRYYDVNARVLHRSANDDVWDAFLVGSSDAFRVIDPDTDEVSIGLTTRFIKLRLLHRHVDDDGWRHESAAIFGIEEEAFQIAPDGDAFERPLDLGLRHELYKAAPDTGFGDGAFGLGLRTGVDVVASRYRFQYEVPSFDTSESGDIGILAPAAYVEPTVRIGRFDLVPGLRADLWSTAPADDSAGWTNLAVDPRFNAAWRFSRKGRLKLGVGKYSQFPDPREVTVTSDGNPDLTHEYALQTGIGWEQRFGEDWSLELNRYYNWLERLVVGNEDAFRFFSGPPPGGELDTGDYENDGTGRSAGIELLLKWQTERTVVFLSNTISHSVRQKRPDQPERLFEYDQPIVLNLLASHEVPTPNRKRKGSWRFGGRFRFGSGNPYDPLVNRWFDLETGEWSPVFSAEQARTPPFYQLDLRVDRSWEFRRWTLSSYLDLQNATNRSNTEVIGYSDDYRTEEPITGLPLVPAFGFKGEW